jgi:hypothetical protein
MIRYNVTVEREVIVYADSKSEAAAKAVAHFNAISTEPPATRVLRAVKVIKLGPVENERHEIIDRAPSRETRT